LINLFDLSLFITWIWW